MTRRAEQASKGQAMAIELQLTLAVLGAWSILATFALVGAHGAEPPIPRGDVATYLGGALFIFIAVTVFAYGSRT